MCLLFRDAANGATEANDSATLAYMQKTFTDHYNGNRQPIGLYTHPIHLSVYNSRCKNSKLLTRLIDNVSWTHRQYFHNQHDQRIFRLGAATTKRLALPSRVWNLYLLLVQFGLCRMSSSSIGFDIRCQTLNWITLRP